MEQAPLHLVGGSAATGLKLCDLDESVWDKLPRQTVEALAELVVARVTAGAARRVFHDRHFPRPPEGVRLADLGLEHRTLLCLAREGFDVRPEALGDHTIGDILCIRAFGPRCLVDLLCALESFVARGGCLSRELTAEAQRLAELPGAAHVQAQDPRFALALAELDAEAACVQDLAERVLIRRHDPPDPLYVAQKLRQLRERIVSMPSRLLEEELIDIFASTSDSRNREIVIGYYGWRDGRSHTLAEIGARYGMTRERTRQICAKLVARSRASQIPAPVLDRTLEFIAQRLPGAAHALEQELAAAGLTAVGLGLEHVRTAAELSKRSVPFALVRLDTGRLAVRREHAALPAMIAELARKEVYYHGAATTDKIREALGDRLPPGDGPSILAETLPLIDGFHWLDRRNGWFRIASATKHGLPKALDKIMAVAGSLGVGELRAALGRNRRVWQEPPPDKVILEFCRQTPGLRVEGDRVIADPPRPWRKAITGVEAQLVAILKEHGPVMDRSALEDLCVGQGMNRFSFHAFVACSPVIAQFGHSVYGLLGAEVSPQAMKSLQDRRRQQRSPGRVLDGHGRTADGRLWLRYRLSRAASAYAVITVPAALKNAVCGRFDLVTRDGRRVGTLAAKDGRAWGLGAFFRRHGARTDDHVVITFDLADRRAEIAFGE